MIVEKIEWISEEAQEALLFISDGEYKCVAFSYPCCLDENDTLSEPILALDSKGIMLSQDAEILIKRHQGESFAHDVVGVLSSLNPTIISIGNLKIELDDVLPKGIKQNDVVQFSCARLDVIK